MCGCLEPWSLFSMTVYSMLYTRYRTELLVYSKYRISMHSFSTRNLNLAKVENDVTIIDIFADNRLSTTKA